MVSSLSRIYVSQRGRRRKRGGSICAPSSLAGERVALGYNQAAQYRAVRIGPNVGQTSAEATA